MSHTKDADYITPRRFHILWGVNVAPTTIYINHLKTTPIIVYSGMSRKGDIFLKAFSALVLEGMCRDERKVSRSFPLML